MKEFVIPAGTHTLKWAYIKDDFVRSGLDSGFVDEFKLHADLDGDGFWADEEAAFGTSDIDPGTGPRAEITTNVAGPTVQFPSVIGRQYRVQHSPDLQTWTTVTLTATSTTTTWTDTTPTENGRRFYRVVVP